MNYSYSRLIKILLLSGAMITSKMALSQSCITVAEDQNPAQQAFDISFLSPGIYLVRLTDHDYTQVQKLVIQK